MCVHCEHELSTGDLLPVVSWLMLHGKCRYCKKPISWQYPAIELLTALLFVAMYYFWPEDLAGLEIGVFAAWLAALVGLVALVVYDIRWMLLPNRLVFPLYAVGGVVIALRLAQTPTLENVVNTIAAVGVGGGLFYLLFQFSRGRWIGGGDVKLGFLLGALLGTPELALLMIFVASILGTLYSVPLMMLKRAKTASRIPFGPFLILGTVIVALFGQPIIDWYLNLLIV